MNIIVKDYVVLLVVLIFQVGSSFAPSQISVFREGSSPRALTNVKLNPQHGNDFMDINENDQTMRINSNQRRHAIYQMLTTMGICSILPPTSKADENLLELDQNKAVMQISSKNYPKKYESSRVTTMPDNSNVVDQLTEAEERRIDVFERVAPSVVYIDTFVEQRDVFSTNVMEVPVGTGSGFVWDDKGHIVTNYHVVRSAQVAQIAVLTRVWDDDEDKSKKNNSIAKRRESMSSMTSMRPGDPGVTNFSRKVYKAKVVGVDPGKDIAVLKIDAPVYDLYPINVGTSTGLRVGQSAYAIGNPFGLDHTLTVGVISGIGREMKVSHFVQLLRYEIVFSQEMVPYHTACIF